MITAIENLNWILDRWEHLTASRLKGTPRPWKEPTLTPEQQAQLDAEARQEKQERGAFVLGESPAPIHLDTLDKLQTHAATINTLAITTALELGHDTHPFRGRPDYRHTPAHINYLTANIANLKPEDLDDLRQVTSRIRAAMAADFAEVFDGKRLKTDCPWCNQPHLYVRLDRNNEPLIVCESGTCEPPDADCGTLLRGKPAWPIHEWDWLANRMNYQEEKTS